MRWHHRLYVTLRGWFRSSTLDRELGEELRFHFDREVQANLDRGLAPNEARRLAAIAVGNPGPIHEASRDQRSGAWPRQFARDLSYGTRLLLRAPGFSAAAITIVALGIAAVTSIFSIVYGVALKPLPFRDPAGLVALWSTSTTQFGSGHYLVNGADQREWVAQNHVFEDIALVRNVANFNLSGTGGEPERLLGARISSNLLPVLGVSPVLGRNFTEDEDEVGSDTRVLLSNALWRRRFNADPSIVGRTINLSGVPFTVVGVMGPDFQYPGREFQLWTPLTINPAELARKVPDRNFLAVARLKPGVSVRDAQSEMNTIAARLAAAYQADRDLGVDVVPLQADLVANVRSALYVMLGAVGCLLLIASLNLAALLSARAATRHRELAVRLALGATRGRIALQTVAEVVPLLVAGGAAGIALATVAVSWLVPFAPASLPRAENIELNGAVLAVSVAIITLSGVIATWLPAMQAWRSTLSSATREQNRSIAGSRRHSRARNVLVVSQIALAVPLLVGAMLLARTFNNLTSTPTGFQPRGVMTAHLAIPRSKYRSDAAIAQLIDRIDERIAAIPGVTAAGMVSRLPLSGTMAVMTFEFDVPDDRRPLIPSVDLRSVTPGYFKAMGIPILEGRTFGAHDSHDTAPAAIVDARIAHTMWPNESAIGKRVRVPAVLANGEIQPWIEIIGVVGHVIHDAVDLDTRPQLYFDQRQRAQDRMAVVARTSGNAAMLAGSIRDVIHQIDPEQPLYDVRTMDEVIERSLGQRWLNTVLIVTFASASLVLCCVGVYGVIAFGVAQTRREFGIRLALGATRASIEGAVLRRGLALASIGAITGLVLAAVLTRSMRALLFAVSPGDAASFVMATTIVIGVALIASYLPARRAAAVDPATTLRAD